MRYISTRGGDTPINFDEALLAGLARDGGLYVPEFWPTFNHSKWQHLKEQPYYEVAAQVIAPFTKGSIELEELRTLCKKCYGSFTHPDIAPLRQLESNLYICELFHGPTLAFKDYAMQLLALLFNRALVKKQSQAIVLGATSGDTGSAALEALKGHSAIDCFILFPEGRVSPIQRRQMTTIAAQGSHAVSVSGTFDDCQALVKTLFNDLDTKDQLKLASINSINWARLVPQIVYYVTSALKLGAPEKPVAFSVPTGNFGNIFAGYVARKMGLPIKLLLCGSNHNDVLPRFFDQGMMSTSEVIPSLSPSMDIQVSSNFERLLFELYDRDSGKVCQRMNELKNHGYFTVDKTLHMRANEQIYAHSVSDEDTVAEIRLTYERSGIILDPHSAIAVSTARHALKERICSTNIPMVALACAHPAKFPQAIEAALGKVVDLPEHLSDLMTRAEHCQRIDAVADALVTLIRHHRQLDE